MTDFAINIVIDPTRASRGTNTVRRELGKVENSADRLRQTLQRAFAFVGVGASIRALFNLSEAFTNVQNRLKVVTDSARELNAVTNELFNISQRTRTSFESNAAIFSRLALATRELGISQQETLSFTESLNKAVIISGASGAEASAGLIQLSQGLASGRLAGDELRSVLEQLPVVADVIAERLGVTRGELRELGSEGRITADVVLNAFSDASERLDAQFQGLDPTIAQSFAILRNQLIKLVGEFDNAKGASASFSRIIITLSENLETVIRSFSALAIVIGVNFARNAIGAAITGVSALTVAIAANPIGLLLVGITSAISALVAFSDRITLGGDSLTTLGDLGQAAFDRLSDGVQFVLDFFSENFGFIATIATTVFSDIDFTIRGFVLGTARLLDNLIGFFIGTFNVIVATFRGLPEAVAESAVDLFNLFVDEFSNLPTTIGNIFIELFNDIISLAQSALSALISGFNRIRGFLDFDPIGSFELPRIELEFEGAGKRLGESISKGFDEGLKFSSFEDAALGLLSSADDIGRQRVSEDLALQQESTIGAAGLSAPGQARDSGPRSDILKVVSDLEKQAQALALNSQQREIQNGLIQIESSLKRQLSSDERELLRATLENVQSLQLQAEVLDSLRAPQLELIQRQQALNSLFVQGKITADEFRNSLLGIRLEQANLNIELGTGTFADGFIVSISEMLEAVRNFNSEAGQLFGDLFTQTTDGFAQAAADAIVFGESFEASIGDVARRALADLLAGLIKLGLQFILNTALGESLGASATAAGVAQAGALGAAYATPAALASLASFGSNAAPAQVGIASTVALSNTLAALPGFRDGGFISGAGGPRSDQIPAMLSNGEFVVNARATSQFRPFLESINSNAPGSNFTAPPQSNQSQQTTNSNQEVTIVNNIDPSILESFLSTSDGQRVILNTIETNSSSVNQILSNG